MNNIKKVGIDIKKFKIIFLLIIFTLILCCLNKSAKNYNAVNDIEKIYKNNESLDEESKNKIKMELKNNVLDDSEKYFILGYLQKEKNEDEEAKASFELSKNSINQKTNDFVKIYSNKLLADYMIKNNDFEKAIDYSVEAFNNVNPVDYNQSYEIIWDIFETLDDKEKGRNIAIENIKNVIHTKLLYVDAQIYLYRSLYNLYMLNRDYTEGIKTSLKIIKLSKKTNNTYYMLKSAVDLSYIARELGGYDTAIDILNSIESDLISDRDLRIDLEVYRLLNLAQCENIIMKYDSAQKHLNKISEYQKFITTSKSKSIECLKNITIADSYSSQGKTELAQKHIDIAKKTLDEASNTYYGLYAYYYLVMGQMELSNKSYKKSIDYFNMSKQHLETHPDTEMYTRVSYCLVKTYKEMGDTENVEKQLMNLLKLQEEKNELISQKYYKYVGYKEDYEQVQKDKKIIKVVIFLACIMISGMLYFILKLIVIPNILTERIKRKIKLYFKNDNYKLNYQPIVNPNTNDIVGFEALIRLNVGGKIIMPNIIISELEQCNMMGDLSIWILNKIITDYYNMKTINYLEDDFYVSMNISLKEIEDEAICEKFKNILRESNIEKDRICLEVTENVCGEDYEKVAKNIKELIDSGFKIAIDDFGVDYSNLSFLEKFDFNVIKLDKYFIDNIENSIIVQRLIDAIYHLSTKKNITVVMEGIEDLKQVELIKKMSNQKFFIQGYYYSKPVEIDKLKDIKVTH
ncbi:EAL domain-containing protein [Romboutsia lituseburensis]|uniref:EAL domain-containing protein n=1 Tax=Romboutsia lituseburensis TaxID=1537 RepID=UPI00215AE68B|nr:EAL domain-containing protein [Romboutsia lituseburensis]MCR8745117.1 EAL domain-containing protein [Romboutsia lituseburensis]